MWWAELLNNIISIFDGGGGAANSYESIATVTVGAGGASTVTFSSIPSTYKHLQVRLIARTNDAVTVADWLMQFNGDGGNNYAKHYIRGNGTSVDAAATASTGAIGVGVIAGNTSTSGIFGGAVIDILDYSNTSKYKTTRSLCGVDINGAFGYVGLFSGLWQNTTAVNQITFFGTTVQNTTVALYGVKG